MIIIKIIIVRIIVKIIIKVLLAQWTKNRLEANKIIAKVVPLRVASIHICLPNSNKFKLLSSIYGIILKRWNARARIHLGNPLEIRYKLQQYGKVLY